jgi:phospholipase/lecithinase/hemolysin
VFHRIAIHILLLGAIFSQSAFAKAKLSSYSDLIVFGDSLSDMANACPRNSKKASLLCPLYSNQRFSDGKLWIEHLAEKFDLRLSASSKGGNNFAFGGAKSGPGSKTVPGLSTQVKTYLDKVGNQADPTALYVIWIGGNDFKDKFLSLSFLSNFEELLFDSLLEDIANSVTLLSRRGARQFLIPNLPPVHRTPMAGGILGGIAGIFTGLSWMRLNFDEKEEAYERDSSLQSLLNLGFETIIGNYNWNLGKRLLALEKEREIKIHHPDVFQLFKNVEEHYSRYGLESPKELFCFDKFHPSARGHEIIAEELGKSL